MITLFKKDSKRKCRIINFWTENDKFCQSAGIKDGKLDATPKMSHEKRKEILLNKKEYIGKTAVITHFGFTNKGLPRIAVYKGYRLDNLIKN